ncbi:hypothetical protein FE257_008866 [Aspergillus nanangensis]|uniref:Uncharacterized protein n=1 Tax=Aspergillus nanangensis TaxID=2582783 RepID=A0AAD4CL86_ASPNN|nr:hypothetical protein FE257_008866 [Aspergillus nanangensis]
MTNVINKVKEAVKHHGDHSSHNPNTSNSTQSYNHGPHDSNIANKTDPRVDSDRDNRAAYQSTATGANVAEPSTGPDANTHSAATGHAPSSIDPRHGNVANETQSGVSNDFGNESNIPSNFGQGRFDKDVHKDSIGGFGVIEGVSGSSGPTTSKRFDQAQQTDSAGAGSSYNNRMTAGPHDSNVANKMDPRVDSDLDGSRSVGSQHQRV